MSQISLSKKSSNRFAGLAAAEQSTVLVVEDEWAIAELLNFTIKAAGWNVERAMDATQAWESLKKRKPDLILLDWMLPDQSGLQLLSRIRSDFNFRTLPVIMVTAKGMEEDKIRGLEKGADDYITKPFSPRELTARVGALLKRSNPEAWAEKLQVGPVTMDVSKFSVCVSGHKVDIGLAEFRLLRFLMANPDKVFNRGQLLDRVWGTQVEIEERTVDVYILRLRKALKEAESIVQTIRGVGYMLSEK